jgi:hypothetical protein
MPGGRRSLRGARPFWGSDRESLLVKQRGIENSSFVSVFGDRDAETDRPVLSVFIRTCFTFRLFPRLFSSMLTFAEVRSS